MNFLHHCNSCDKTQLIFLSMVKGIDGDTMSFTCWCGADETAPFSQGPRVLV